MRIIFLVCSMLVFVSCNVEGEKEYQSQLSSVSLAQNVAFDEDTSYSFDLDTKGGTVAYRITKWPVSGVLKLCFETSDVETGDKRCVFTPRANFNGNDEIHLLAVDTKNGDQRRVVIPLIVTPVNDAPLVSDKKVSAPVGESVSFSLGEDFSDPDGDTFFVKLFNNPSLVGEVNCANNGSSSLLSCTYLCDKQECLKIQNETLTFFAEDSKGVRKQGVVSVNLTTPIDQDGDYVPDYVELENGTNPIAADLPRVSSIELLSTSISYEVGEDVKKIETDTRVDDNGKMLTLYSRKQLDKYFLGRGSERTIGQEDLFQVAGLLLPEKYKINSDLSLGEQVTLISNLNIKLSSIKHITNVKNISVSLYSINDLGATKVTNGVMTTKGGYSASFNNYNKEQSANLLDLIAKFDQIPSSVLVEYANGKIELGIKIDNIDYEIRYLGKAVDLKTSKEIERLSQTSKKVIVASEEVGSFYSYVPAGQKIEKILEYFDSKLEISDGKLRRLFGLSNEGVSIDLSTSSGSDPSSGAWTIFGDCGEDNMNGNCYVVFETILGRKQIEARKFNQSNIDQKAVTEKTKISFFGEISKTEGQIVKTNAVAPIKAMDVGDNRCYRSPQEWAKCVQAGPDRVEVVNGTATFEVSSLSTKTEKLLSLVESEEFLPISIGNRMVHLSELSNYSEEVIGGLVSISFEVPSSLLNYNNMAIVRIEQSSKNTECYDVGFERIIGYKNERGLSLPEWVVVGWVKNPYITYPVKTTCMNLGVSYNGIFSIDE